ncbi:MAG: hypothetical protein VYA34_05870 [Myxococcota bacterium]|nr:hypothetical protein [Myxococcota bacterium]
MISLKSAIYKTQHQRLSGSKHLLSTDTDIDSEEKTTRKPMVSSALSPKLVSHGEGGKDPDGLIDNHPGVAYPKLNARKDTTILKSRSEEDTRRCPKTGNDIVQKTKGHSKNPKNLLGPEKTCRSMRRSMLGPLGPVRRKATCEKCNEPLIEGTCKTCPSTD